MDATDNVRAEEIEAVAREMHANGVLSWIRREQLDQAATGELREKARRAHAAKAAS
jgi:hypothetical protein